MSRATIYTNPANVERIIADVLKDPAGNDGDSLVVVESETVPAACECCGRPVLYIPSSVPFMPGHLYEWHTPES